VPGVHGTGHQYGQLRGRHSSTSRRPPRRSSPVLHHGQAIDHRDRLPVGAAQGIAHTRRVRLCDAGTDAATRREVTANTGFGYTCRPASPAADRAPALRGAGPLSSQHDESAPSYSTSAAAVPPATIHHRRPSSFGDCHHSSQSYGAPSSGGRRARGGGHKADSHTRPPPPPARGVRRDDTVPRPRRPVCEPGGVRSPAAHSVRRSAHASTLARRRFLQLPTPARARPQGPAPAMTTRLPAHARRAGPVGPGVCVRLLLSRAKPSLAA